MLYLSRLLSALLRDAGWLSCWCAIYALYFQHYYCDILNCVCMLYFMLHCIFRSLKRGLLHHSYTNRLRNNINNCTYIVFLSNNIIKLQDKKIYGKPAKACPKPGWKRVRAGVTISVENQVSVGPADTIL